MVVESVLTFAAEGILSKVSSLAANKIALAWGFKAELEKLRQSLSYIQDLLGSAADQRLDDRGKAVEEWVKKLKQVAEDADDVLDEFEYELLRQQVELRNDMVFPQKMFCRKVLNFLSASNPLWFRFNLAHKIKKINDSLVELKNEAPAIILVAKKGDSRRRPDRVQTDAFFEIENGEKEKVVGREDAVRKIVTTLISSDNQQKNLSVMAIVGMAGLGKTTLAKSVYNEPDIDKHFDKRIWVCVSNTFEVFTILSQMVDTVVPEKAGMKCQNAILEALREKLTGKRYLLVLDDVWNKEKEKWDSLMSCLSKLNSKPGSCIIVTTRSTNVSTIAETLPRPELTKLSEEDCWSIIKQRALKDENDAELERIGREIAEKCGGVPLVAKVLGSLLRSKASEVAARPSTVAEWSSIRDNRLWDLREGEDRIMKVLKLSFDNLEPSPLKQCFAYCSMLRKDFEIERDNLIQLWMAQGLLQTSTVENHHVMEDTGKEYFNILLNNSLIQKVIERGTITKYTMHDLVHDLAEKVSKSERLTQELNDDVRHVARSRPPSTLENMSEVTVGRLRSLFSNDQVPDIVSSKFKAMRVLSFDTADIKELPKSFGKLKHLRYLDLSDTGIKALPKSIGKLYNLQTLRMQNCDMNELPREMQNLINLRNLVLDRCSECEELPILGHLPFLRDVKIKGMHNLKRIGSEIYGYDLVYEATREKETIVLFPALKTLSISYCLELIEWMEAPTTTMTKVEVFPCLEELTILCCPRIGFIPIPCSMASLRELRIEWCDALSSIGQLDHCTSLQELEINSCEALSSIGLEGLSSLRKLRIERCDALSSIGQLDHCTSLQELEIKYCIALSSIGLEGLSSLRELQIVGCKALSSIGPTSSQGLPSLRELIIVFCDGLSALPSGIENCYYMYTDAII
uniref:putative disease resistance protein RGA3 isoform X1 n=1 Tax=Fragaria vesca subsp. vesca TaxID=101020 RepID=UPI0005C866D6|nr:PREDICTED: putative disease resistance protein RGA3 isoform X1 [Fragaria vesca subsp. vesca]